VIFPISFIDLVEMKTSLLIFLKKTLDLVIGSFLPTATIITLYLVALEPSKLEQLILDGNSMFVFDKDKHFFTSSILAGTCAIAAGVAYALKKSGSENWVYCFLGDGAEEQGHFYEAVMFVEGQDLPCMFIIEDNDRQVDTTFEERNPNKFKFEMPSCVIRNKYKATYPHAGNGTKKHIVFKERK